MTWEPRSTLRYAVDNTSYNLIYVAFAIGAGLVAAAAVATPTAPPASAGAANYLAAACTNCHATTKVAGDVLPLLAGQLKETLIDKLERFRDGPPSFRSSSERRKLWVCADDHVWPLRRWPSCCLS